MLFPSNKCNYIKVKRVVLLERGICLKQYQKWISRLPRLCPLLEIHSKVNFDDCHFHGQHQILSINIPRESMSICEVYGYELPVSILTSPMPQQSNWYEQMNLKVRRLPSQNAYVVTGSMVTNSGSKESQALVMEKRVWIFCKCLYNQTECRLTLGTTLQSSWQTLGKVNSVVLISSGTNSFISHIYSPHQKPVHLWLIKKAKHKQKHFDSSYLSTASCLKKEFFWVITHV